MWSVSFPIPIPFTSPTTMHLTPEFAERSIPALRTFIRANPLGMLITALESEVHPLLQCSHIPWVLDVADDASESELGTLRGHMARANPQAQVMAEKAKAQAAVAGTPVGRLDTEVLVMFNGPVHHYVTPKFYAETKPTTRKVVPTWNYVAVEAHGIATVYFDMKAPESTSFLSQQIADLSRQAETEIMGYEKPWMPSDAPESYIRLLTKAIIGVEIKITRLAGKWKMSQNKTGGDRTGVVEGFASLGNDVGDYLAKTIQERAEISDAEKASKK